MSRSRILAVLLSAALALAACGGGDDDSAGSSGTELVGLFAIEPGECTEAGASGSTFRMVQPGGDPASGPFMDNGDSSCGDKSWSPLVPGADGGLRTGGYQPQIEPFFDENGNSTSRSIAEPTTFFAVGFGLSTNETDPQTEVDVPAPTATVADGVLQVELSALSVSWNEQFFNQGSPKPGQDAPLATGEYDAETGRYSLDWTSLIEGGPFDGFTGVWHLEGSFTEA